MSNLRRGASISAAPSTATRTMLLSLSLLISFGLLSAGLNTQSDSARLGRVVVSSLISSNAVLQTNYESGLRGQIWGWTSEPDELVSINASTGFNLQAQSSSQPEPGCVSTNSSQACYFWSAQFLEFQVFSASQTAQQSDNASLNIQSSSTGKPFNLTISTSSSDAVHVDNLVFGDVYVCAGDAELLSNDTIPSTGRLPSFKAHVRYGKAATSHNAASSVKVFLPEAGARAGSSTLQQHLPGRWIELDANALPGWAASSLCIAAAIKGEQTHFNRHLGVVMLPSAAGSPAELCSWASPGIAGCSNSDNRAPSVEQPKELAATLRSTTSNLHWNSLLAPASHLHFRAMLFFHGIKDFLMRNITVYRTSYAGIVNAWRDDFGFGDFALLSLEMPVMANASQSSAFGVQEADSSALAELRQAQAAVMPNGVIQTTGLVVTSDSCWKCEEHFPLLVNRTWTELLVTTVGFSCVEDTPAAVMSCFPLPSHVLARSNATWVVLDVSFRYAQGLALRPVGNASSCDNGRYVEVQVGPSSWVAVDTRHLRTSSDTLTVELPRSATPGPVSAIRYGWHPEDLLKCTLTNGLGLPSVAFVLNVSEADLAGRHSSSAAITPRQHHHRTPSTPTSVHLQHLQRLMSFEGAEPKKPLSPSPGLQLDNGLARTPPLGWETWNAYHSIFGSRIIERLADAVVSSGLKDAGYQYIIFDEWTAKERGWNDTLYYDRRRFPNGVSSLCDYIHSRGLKCGIYTACQPTTAQRRASSYLHAAQDAQLLASWGADYVFVDMCSNGTFYQEFSTAMNLTGRPVVIAAHGTMNRTTANLWRTNADLQFSWQSVLENAYAMDPFVNMSGPGGWNYADMLEVGNAGLSFHEQLSHFMMWSIVASPLITSNMVYEMDNATRSILTAPEILAVNQDKLGKQGTRVVGWNTSSASPCRPTCGTAASSERSNSSDIQVTWRKALKDGSLAVLLTNLCSTQAHLVLDLSAFGFAPSQQVHARDLWLRKDIGTSSGCMSFKDVPRHASVMLKLKSVS